MRDLLHLLHRAARAALTLALAGVTWIHLCLHAPPSARAADPLSDVHAYLDTSDQCGKCHGDDINVADPAKCRDCHRDIDRRVRSAKGYHGRIPGDVNCNLCHREHLGRSYQIVQMNVSAFDHVQTGWPLSGKHAQTECRQCHTQKRPSGRDSYLDTSPECKQCHGQFHGQGIAADLDGCEGCHNAFGWKTLNSKLKFDHQTESRYPLTGKHKTDVGCLDCHTERTPQGQLKRFGPISVRGCESCHKDPHPQGIFSGISCAECHVTEGFQQTAGFDHTSVGWPLLGAHKKEPCLSCHKWEQWAPPSKDCVGCHEDVHRGQFKDQQCSACHQETSFSDLKFDHNTQSRFPLKGSHQRVECAACHEGGHYKPIDMECASCHEKDNPHGDTFQGAACSQCHTPVSWKKTHFDHSVTGFALEARHEEQPCYRCHPSGTETEDDTRRECAFCHTQRIHGGQFPQTDCAECHKSADRWAIPFFDHTRSRFALTGQHLQQSCEACHKDGHFKPIDTSCGNCHQNFHEGQLTGACDSCHSTDLWGRVAFDHDRQSSYPLEGKHEGVECKKCHIENRYKGVETTCESCHLDVHLGAKGSDCKQCHTVAGWELNQTINHDFGAFRIGGVHDTLPCERCHNADRSKQLSGTGAECVSCHADPHFGSLGPLCQDCHTQSEFLPSTFLHNGTGFRLSGAHRFVACRDCHPNRVFGGIPKDCEFCHTDTFQTTAGSSCDHPTYCPEGLNNCQDCHTSTSFVRARPGTQCGPCKAGGVRP
ncbi:MAG: hypothetical protein FJ138_01420 [Deltaproteobacteria bacterium]|nr:hypothetical protein [Deltaproteobacteria bacterium]